MKDKFKEVPFIDFKQENWQKEGPDDKYTIELIRVNYGEYRKDKTDSSWTIATELDTPDFDKFFSRRDVDWGKIKTIYFDGTCTVPRFKLGNFCTKNNIKVVRDRTKADLILFGTKLRNNLLRYTYDVFVPKQVFLDKVERKELLTDIIPIVEKCDCEYVIMNRRSNYFSKEDRPSGHYWKVLDYPIFCDITSPDSKYASQDVVLKEMGEHPMDEKTYRRLCEFFETDNKDNHVLAMEMMSNTNYEDSIVYLLNLMRIYHGEKMWPIQERNNVSFKALRNYLGYAPRNYDRSLNSIIEIIAEKDLLSEDNYNLILNLILEQEKKEMGPQTRGHSEDNWRILKVDLSEEFKSKVIWNKKEEIEAPVGQPDFTA